MRSEKALKNLVTFSILQIVTFICGFIVPKLILKYFGSEVNGLINSIIQFLGYITLLESGFGPVVKSILYKPIANNEKSKIESILKSSEKFFRKIAIIFIIYILILCFVYPIIVNNGFEKFYTISLILIIGISTFAEYFFGMTYKLYLQAEQKGYITASIQIITTIINTILVLILIKLGANIQIVKLVSALIYIMRPILQNIYVKRKYHINLKKVNEEFEIKQKWDGLAQHIAGVIHGNTDIVILTLFSRIKEISVYSVYNLVISGIRNVITILSNGIESTFGNMIANNEKENLNRKFSMYEFLYFTIITILYSCTMVLIVPFVKVYTLGITDVEYERTMFAYILVFAYFIHAIKTPYNNLAYIAGKFKETQKGAWVEAGLNLSISLLLVNKLGLVGIAIGTFISVLVRGIEFIFFTSKNILNRKILKTIVKCLITIMQLIIVAIIGEYFTKNFIEISYLGWFILAMKIFIISLIIIVPFNLIYYKKEFKDFLSIIKNLKIKTKNKKIVQ